MCIRVCVVYNPEFEAFNFSDQRSRTYLGIDARGDVGAVAKDGAVCRRTLGIPVKSYLGRGSAVGTDVGCGCSGYSSFHGSYADLSIVDERAQKVRCLAAEAVVRLVSVRSRDLQVAIAAASKFIFTLLNAASSYRLDFARDSRSYTRISLRALPSIMQ
jgi:hypothetical protein